MIRSIGPRNRPPLSATFRFATGVFVGCGVASRSSATSTPVRSMTIRTTKFAELSRKRNAAIAVANAVKLDASEEVGRRMLEPVDEGSGGLRLQGIEHEDSQHHDDARARPAPTGCCAAPVVSHSQSAMIAAPASAIQGDSPRPQPSTATAAIPANHDRTRRCLVGARVARTQQIGDRQSSEKAREQHHFPHLDRIWSTPSMTILGPLLRIADDTVPCVMPSSFARSVCVCPTSDPRSIARVLGRILPTM